MPKIIRNDDEFVTMRRGDLRNMRQDLDDAMRRVQRLIKILLEMQSQALDRLAAEEQETQDA